jgi:hypothetical protein
MTLTPTATSTRTGGAAGRDILIALAVKLSLLTVLYCCFFAEGHRPKADAGATAAALLDHPSVIP